MDFDEQSKVDKLLGSGKVAEILLWRDEKKSFTYFFTLVLLYYWFFLCGRTFISSAAKLLLLIAVILYGYHILPLNIFSFTIPRISLSSFEISEVAASLYFFKLIASCFLTIALGVALVLAFASLFVYEQYEEEIDGIATFLFKSVRKALGLLMKNLPMPVASFLCSSGMLQKKRLTTVKDQQ
ncbi:unnamed protein product [Ilex paraguariensis]|uniref:Reticulon domain-containing protein n=1 Tax=Ilex paraguariensis TaxID=185542 RepID=A0ABC8RUF4_9AQUA